MKHSFLDEESKIESPIRSLNPKTKFVAFVLMVFIIVSTPATAKMSFLLYLTVALTLIVISHIPIKFFIKRLLIITPFILMAVVAVPFIQDDLVGTSFSLGIGDIEVSNKGLLIVFNVLAKSTLSITFLSLLVSTTPMMDLIKGLRELKFPPFLADSLSFMYQYVFVIVDEIHRISRARDARSYGGRWIWHAHIIGYMIGTLFVRSYERGERVYLAMKARGYDSELIFDKTGNLKANDIIFLLLVIPVALIIRIWGINL